MMVKFSSARPTLVAGVCGAAMLALTACDGPPRPEPSAPPPSPEQVYEDEAQAGDDRFADADLGEGGEPLEEEKPPLDDEDVDVEPVVTMEPIPNPGDEAGEPAEDDLPVLEPYNARAEAAAEPDKPEPYDGAAIADAADPLPAAEPAPASRMAPIPNPPAQRRARADDGLMGAPSAMRRAEAAPAPERATPVRPAATGAAGPSVRVPIRSAAPIPASPAAAGLRPAAEAEAAGVRPADQPVRLDRVERDLRRLVEGQARLDAPATWTPGETREVRLRLPAGVADRLEQAAVQTGGGQGARELSATLSGDGFRIDPAGPQSIDPAAADGALAWRVTPERAEPGPLTARVEAAVPTRLGERRTLSLGEVSDGRGGGGLSMRTLGWILLVVLGGGLLAWFLGRRNGDAAAADGRRRNRLRAEQRRDRAGPLDLSPGDARSDPARS